MSVERHNQLYDEKPYEWERNLAIATLRRMALRFRFCEGCVGSNFAQCIYPDGPGEDVRCDDCGQCICGKCKGQSGWSWTGKPAPDMAQVVHCRDCKHEGLVTCPITYIERHAMVFIAHDPDWFCADGERKES